jgi:hypothetical protein
MAWMPAYVTVSNLRSMISMDETWSMVMCRNLPNELKVPKRGKNSGTLLNSCVQAIEHVYLWCRKAICGRLNEPPMRRSDLEGTL